MRAKHTSDKYSDAVEVSLAASGRARAFVAVGALATLALVFSMPIPAEVRALAIGWTGVLAAHALRRAGTPCQFALQRTGEIRVDDQPGRVRDASFVAPWLTVVRWLPDGALLERSLLILPDMLPPDDFRRLRVLLKFGDRPLSPLSEIQKRTKGSVPES